MTPIPPSNTTLAPPRRQRSSPWRGSYMSVSTLMTICLPGNFRPQERKFQGTNVPWNESLWNFRPRERKFPGTKVPENESSTLWNPRDESSSIRCFAPKMLCPWMHFPVHTQPDVICRYATPAVVRFANSTRMHIHNEILSQPHRLNAEPLKAYPCVDVDFHIEKCDIMELTLLVFMGRTA